MIAAEGGVAEIALCDVTVDAECKAAVAKAVEVFGKVDILVNIGETLPHPPQPGPAWDKPQWARGSVG
jgi:NAD(P)-dependent dehydrogenase (short-subunit alcohol dehydrogenase family)